MNFVGFLTKRLCRVLCDCLLLVVLLVLAQLFPQLGRPVTQRGFFCNDETLRYPFHEGTVSEPMLYAIGLYLPLLVIVCVELYDYLVNVRYRHHCGSDEDVVAKPSVSKPLQQFYQVVSAFLLGYAGERFFKSLGKATIGRLRPNFFAVCQPQLLDGRTCADPLLAGIYIEQYRCLGGEGMTERMLRTVHLSFPSGHSSLSFYGMVFLALYLQHRLCVHCFGARMMKPLLQLGCLLIGWFVTLSRIMDNMHHWSDSLAGSLLGTFIAVFVYVTLVNNFAVKTRPNKLQRCDCVKAVKFNEVLTEVKYEPSDPKG